MLTYIQPVALLFWLNFLVVVGPERTTFHPEICYELAHTQTVIFLGFGGCEDKRVRSAICMLFWARMTVCCWSTSLVFKIIYLAICSFCTLLFPPPIRAAVSAHMVQPANLNALFAPLRKPIKFAAEESPDYRADRPCHPLNSFLWCVYSCVDLYKHAAEGNFKARSSGDVWQTLRLRVCLSLS